MWLVSELPLEVRGNAERENQGCNAEQGQTWYVVWFFNDDLSCHRDQSDFQNDTNVNGIFLYVCLQRFDSSTPISTSRKYPKTSSKP
jgi:hypothetical protein